MPVNNVMQSVALEQVPLDLSANIAYKGTVLIVPSFTTQDVCSDENGNTKV